MVSSFLLLVAVSSTFCRFQATSLSHTKKGFKSAKVLEIPPSSKNETIVEGQRLRTADILSMPHDTTGEHSGQRDAETDRQTRRHTAPNCTTHRSTPQRNPLFSLLPSPSPLFCSSLPFSHTLLSCVSCQNSWLYCQKKKFGKKKSTQPGNILAPVAHQTRQEKSQRQVH